VARRSHTVGYVASTFDEALIVNGGTLNKSRRSLFREPPRSLRIALFLTTTNGGAYRIDTIQTARQDFRGLSAMRNQPSSTSNRRISIKLRWRTLAVSSLLITAACNGSLYKVKPPTDLPPIPSDAPAVNIGSLSLQAAPLLTDEETQELFEANLQLAGLLPVRVALRHNGGEAIDVKKLRLGLHDASGAQWKMVSAKQAISHILKANGVFAYNPNSRKTFEKEFRGYELDLKTPFTESERRRQGLVIFLSPKKDPVSSPRNLVLTIDGLAQPGSLKLN